MTGVRKSVGFTGKLIGQGHEAQCTVTAVQVQLSGAGQFAYANFAIHAVHQKLPVGIYKLHVNGGAEDVQQTAEGYWIAA